LDIVDVEAFTLDYDVEDGFRSGQTYDAILLGLLGHGFRKVASAGLLHSIVEGP
jgi:hypothetical protein